MHDAVKNGRDADAMQSCATAVEKHGAHRDALIPILSEVNHELGYIPARGVRMKLQPA